MRNALSFFLWKRKSTKDMTMNCLRLNKRFFTLIIIFKQQIRKKKKKEEKVMNLELERTSLLKSFEDEEDNLNFTTDEISVAQIGNEDLECSEKVENELLTPYRKMIFLTIIVTFPSVLCGMAFSYSAVALPQMNLSIAEASWFGSAHAIAAPIGGISVSFIIDLFGRKSAIIAAMIPNIIGWFLIFLDYNPYLSILGRCFTGLPTGTFFYPVQVYISESIAVNDPCLRTTFATAGSLLAGSGVFITFLLGSFVTYRPIAAFALIFTITTMSLILFTIPESPTWLHLQGRIKDARKSEKRLGIYQPILHEGPTSAQMNCNELRWKDFHWVGFMNGLSKFKRKDIYKPVFTMSILAILRAATAGQAVLTYAIHIMSMDTLSEAPSTTIDQFNNAYKCSFAIGLVVISSRFLSLCTTHCLGTKKLGIGAAVVLCSGHFIMGYVWSRKEIIDTKLFYLNIVGVLMVEFGFFGGVNLFPNTILSDTLPRDAKRFGAFVIVISQISTFVVIKLHPYLNLYYESYVYFGYFSMGIIFGIYLAFMPETVGKTSEEVQKEFSSL